MYDANKIEVFPKTKDEALTFLYVKNNSDGKSPEELVDLYNETLAKVTAQFYSNSAPYPPLGAVPY